MYRLSSPVRSPRLYTANVKEQPIYAAVESSAFFIQDYATGREIIVFGDVEPDSVSLDPRNKRVWEVAAPKIAAGMLRAIFIECSYNDSVDDALLYGHLCPRHLVAELSTLARKVIDCQRSKSALLETGSMKRKRTNSIPMGTLSPKSNRSPSSRKTAHVSTCQADLPPADDLVPDTSSHDKDALDADNNSAGLPMEDVHFADNPLPLAGLSVYIIHVKGTLTDGPPPGGQILHELRRHGENAGLGCDFYIPGAGEGIFI